MLFVAKKARLEGGEGPTGTALAQVSGARRPLAREGKWRNPLRRPTARRCHRDGRHGNAAKNAGANRERRRCFQPGGLPGLPGCGAPWAPGALCAARVREQPERGCGRRGGERATTFLFREETRPVAPAGSTVIAAAAAARELELCCTPAPCCTRAHPPVLPCFAVDAFGALLFDLSG